MGTPSKTGRHLSAEHKARMSFAVRAAWSGGKFDGKRRPNPSKETRSIAAQRWADERRAKGAIPGKASTPEAEATRRRKLSEWAKLKGNGGYKPGSGRSRKSWHDSPTAGRVFLQSSYEVRYAIVLDRLGIAWEKNWKSFGYTFGGEERRYVPDFYLTQTDEYVEVKGYETKRDVAKWAAFPHRLTVVKEADLKRMEGPLMAGESSCLENSRP
jgi:hypothetical protein